MTTEMAIPKFAKILRPGVRIIEKATGQAGVLIPPQLFPPQATDEHPFTIRLDSSSSRHEVRKAGDILVDVPKAYLESLAPIYRDIFQAFWMFNPNGRPEWGVAYQSLHSVMSDKYTLGQIREACNELVRHDALELRGDQFYHPTPMGEGIIRTIQQGATSTTTTTPPPFLPPIPAGT
ncbi:MAG TPA: hypothetical protein VM165_08185 [Planctomycetaceae bacterium]|nr:hypothetical protein [Planctomycetaceae bacterium]